MRTKAIAIIVVVAVLVSVGFIEYKALKRSIEAHQRNLQQVEEVFKK